MDIKCSTCMNKSMFNKHQRWTALLVAFTFFWLLQVSAKPLVALDATEQVAAASVEQATGFIEQSGDDWGRVRPRSAPILFILAVVALALLYVLIHGIDIDAAPRTATGPSKADLGRLPAAHFGQNS
jgi:hypothetical protein